MGLEATLLLGHYSQKPLTLWVVGNGSTDHLEDIWASRIMGQTRSRVAHKVSSQPYNYPNFASLFTVECSDF